jgi:hypothetical protein
MGLIVDDDPAAPLDESTDKRPPVFILPELFMGVVSLIAPLVYVQQTSKL